MEVCCALHAEAPHGRGRDPALGEGPVRVLCEALPYSVCQKNSERVVPVLHKDAQRP